MWITLRYRWYTNGGQMTFEITLYPDDVTENLLELGYLRELARRTKPHGCDSCKVFVKTDDVKMCLSY